jgi:DNA mismatch repair protein MutL
VNVRIKQLDSLLANQIAAGEVVERPASVVKELVENSLDANATKIEIELEGGGSHLIRIRDNGQGIHSQDLILAFSRHATSKISHLSDLNAIGTLGFRGEALASIASIARCRLISKTQDQTAAWQIQLAPDLEPILNPASHPNGTTIEVADLFYNAPVRRKFLRSEKSEFQYIDEMIKRLALSHPKVSFRLKHQQRQIRQFTAQDLYTNDSMRMAQICGQSFAKNAIQIDIQACGLTLKGWLGQAIDAKRQADCQYFFVNSRMIKDRLINHVIKTVYQQFGALPEGTYPCYVLYLSLSASEVDVNVHPTKQEVRFAQTRLVHDFISKCVKDALVQSQYPRDNHNHTLNLPKVQEPRCYQETQQTRDVVQEESRTLPAGSALNTFARYVVQEEDNGLFIVDLQKAQSSLLAHYFKNKWGSIPSKPLLFPRNLKLAKGSFAKVSAALAAIGFLIKEVDATFVALMQQPAIVGNSLDQALFDQIVLLLKLDLDEMVGNLSQLLLADFAKMPADDLKALIQTWRLSEQACGYVKLSQQKLNDLMAPSFATAIA